MSSSDIERPAGHFRYIVTGNNAAGHSYFVKNEFVKFDSSPGYLPTLFHTTPDQFATYLGNGGPGDIQEILPPNPVQDDGMGFHEEPKHGAVSLSYFQIPDEMDAFFKQGDQIERTDGEAGWKYGFHRHRTIDYITITQGEFWLYMEQGEAELKPGDIVIQRNTHHTWQRFDYKGPCGFVAAIITCHGL
jgi:hypothetical protein